VNQIFIEHKLPGYQTEKIEILKKGTVKGTQSIQTNMEFEFNNKNMNESKKGRN
jgi:hypothetical protein